MATMTIPYAVADFVDLRERGFYYVDKTNYISKLEYYNAPVFRAVLARVCLSLRWPVIMIVLGRHALMNFSVEPGSVAILPRNITNI